MFLGPLNLQATIDDFDMTRAITVFAPDENITVSVDMAGSAGQSFNGNSGGEGGRCSFTTTLQKGVEYTFKLGATVEPTSSIGRGGAGAYFYEKGRLLVACGGGGASGWYGGSGGDGGGAGVAGASGSGQNRGTGGIKYNDGIIHSHSVVQWTNKIAKCIRNPSAKSCYKVNKSKELEEMNNNAYTMAINYRKKHFGSIPNKKWKRTPKCPGSKMMCERLSKMASASWNNIEREMRLSNIKKMLWPIKKIKIFF